MATSTAPSETIPTSTLADPQSTSLQPPISSSDSVNNNVIAGLSVPRGPDGLPVNLSEVSALPARDMVSLINEFVVSTAQFLNRFARLCDKRLAKVSSTVDRIGKHSTTFSLLLFRFYCLDSLIYFINC